jgi:hypothetical protein
VTNWSYHFGLPNIILKIITKAPPNNATCKLKIEDITNDNYNISLSMLKKGMFAAALPEKYSANF